MKLELNVPEFHEGDGFPGAGTLNRINKLGRRVIDGSNGVNVSTFTDRTVVGYGKHSIIHADELALFKVIREYPDALLCKKFHYDNYVDFHETDPNFPYGQRAMEGLIWVMKPRLLQQTPFDGRMPIVYNPLVSGGSGVSVTYNYDTDVIGLRFGTTEFDDPDYPSLIETIQPSYFSNDIIAARLTSTGFVIKTPKPSGVSAVMGTGSFFIGIPDLELFVEGQRVMIFWDDGSGGVLARVGLVITSFVKDIDGNPTGEVTFSDSNDVLLPPISNGDTLPGAGGAVNVTPEQQVVWQDINEGGRKWEPLRLMKGEIDNIRTPSGSACDNELEAEGTAIVVIRGLPGYDGLRVVVNDWLGVAPEKVTCGQRIYARLIDYQWWVDGERC